MAETKTKIANRALVAIGENPVGNVDAIATKACRAIRTLWNQVVSEVQEEFLWRELTTLRAIDPHPDETADGLKKFPVPEGALRIETVDACVFERRGSYLVADREGALEIKYVRFAADPATWSDALARCVAAKLAAEICTLVRDDERVRARLEATYQAALRKAKRRQSTDFESERTRPARSGWIAARGRRFSE